MSKLTPMFVCSKNAAKLLDMNEREFLKWVRDGALPGPVKFERWDVQQLCAIMKGDAARPAPEQEFEF